MTPSGGPLPPQQNQPFGLSMPNIKTEPDAFSSLGGMPASRLSTSVGGSPDAGVATDNVAIDSGLMRSPSAVQTHSPISATTSMTPGGTSAGMNILGSPSTAFTPGQQLNFSDLQGMDFLQGLQGSAGADGDASGEQMDLGFGLGWEGMHHDFSDGQQVDLFDGFFFGGQQGGGGGGAPGGGGM